MKNTTRTRDFVTMERATHNDNDEHVIDVTTDDDSTPGSSLYVTTDDETHNDNDEHVIDVTTDDDYSTPRSSLDEGSYSSLSSPLSTDDETSDDGASSSSTRGCDSFWNTLELVVTLVHIVAALVILTLAKDEHPHALLLAWLIGYTCGCITIALLIILSLLRKYNQVGVYSRSRVDRVMEVLKIGVECLFFVWLILGIVWICDAHSSPSDAPKLHRLCVGFIAFSCIRYAFTLLLCADSLLGGGLYFQRPSPDDCCCICLETFGEEERIVIRKLECSHVFHSKCIDKWLRVKSTCPLCQSLVRD
ncbi:PREDICTED: E3 ubiquitin-protein ligase At4g11680-like [Camelina sativa]|uniref:E3 ubiquitin-protein ligase At4g11680-like n=1 Tax=Camelina sativa TaxID=90675 RepID=A0ABM0VXU9_CAMSA|nr:PREDICTED: E3 ubiquitin-protein ligase At4g11680-like [Camelina sativa]